MNVMPHKRNDEYLPFPANNEGLEVLDLSWNHLRMKGAVAFSAGLKVCLCKKYIGSLTLHTTPDHTLHYLGEYDVKTPQLIMERFW